MRSNRPSSYKATGTLSILFVLTSSIVFLIYNNYRNIQVSEHPSLKLDLASSEKEPQHVETPVSQAYHSAHQAYSQQDYTKAVEVFFPWEQEFIHLAEGCELMLSCYARLKNFTKLDQIANLCLNSDKAIDTALDAIAFSMSSAGQITAAIERLNNERLRFPHSERLEFALSKLYFLNHQEDLGQKSFLFGIQKASTWSMWVVHALQREEFTNNIEFMTELSVMIQSKQNRIPKVEESIIRKLRELGKDKLADQHQALLEDPQTFIQS